MVRAMMREKCTEAKDDTEGIEEVQASKGRIKMVNGQLLIVCGDKIYTITGQEVK